MQEVPVNWGLWVEMLEAHIPGNLKSQGGHKSRPQMESPKRSVSYSQAHICTSLGRHKSDSAPSGSAGFCATGGSKASPGAPLQSPVSHWACGLRLAIGSWEAWAVPSSHHLGAIFRCSWPGVSKEKLGEDQEAPAQSWWLWRTVWRKGLHRGFWALLPGDAVLLGVQWEKDHSLGLANLNRSLTPVHPN